ncbi:MAG: hydrogenase maturation protease [Gammaproteobacteria bacterium]|nr:hydrogenase maturation protease [Gammaproteobacteria bacterium]
MKTLIVALGSPYGDDAIAWLCLDFLRQQSGLGLDYVLFKSKGNGLDWMQALASVDQLIFMDAVIGDKELGKIHLLRESALPTQASMFQSSSHQIPLDQSINIARNLGYLSKHARVWILGIEIKRDSRLVLNANKQKQVFSQVWSMISPLR